jgi:hypothetical protein
VRIDGWGAEENQIAAAAGFKRRQQPQQVYRVPDIPGGIMEVKDASPGHRRRPLQLEPWLPCEPWLPWLWWLTCEVEEK